MWREDSSRHAVQELGHAKRKMPNAWWQAYGGMASPRFKHGWYSNDPIYRCMRIAIEARRRQVRRLRKRLAKLGLDPDLAEKSY